MPIQTPIVLLHLFLLAALLIGHLLLRERVIGRILWLVGFASSTLLTVGLLALFAALVLTPAGFIHPLAFAGGFAGALVAYGTLAAIYFWTRPRPLAFTGSGWSAACVVFLVLNTLCFYTPKIASRPIVVSILTHDGKPLPGAEVTFKHRDSKVERRLVTNANGSAVLPMPYMATIEGKVSLAGFGGHSFYIAPNERTSGARLNIQQRSETKFLGDLPSIGGGFLYSTPIAASFRLEVFLQKVGEGRPLPFKPIADLATHLREAQAIGGSYPIVLASGDTFNPEMKAQSPEAYNQLRALLAAYDPKGPLRYYAANYWMYFLLQNEEHHKQLKRILDLPESDPTRAANAVILATLLGENVSELSTEAILQNVSHRLDDDKRTLEVAIRQAKSE